MKLKYPSRSIYKRSRTLKKKKYTKKKRRVY